MVISIILMFLGGLGIVTLPMAQLPDVAPPMVRVSLVYPGASANVLVKSTLIPMEQAINGVQNMRYMRSAATSAGEATIKIYFEPGTDPNINVVNVRNRINTVLSRIPPIVRREGIMVRQVVPSMLMYLSVYSTNPDHDQKFLYNFVNANMLPVLKRIKGMGLPRNLGNRRYAMRVWLKPDRMRAYKVSAQEVMKALEEQSMIASIGRLGRATGKTSQSREYVLTYVGRYTKPEQYGDVILRAKPNGEVMKLKDVADVELDCELYDIYSDMNGYPAAAVILKQSPGSNAVEVIGKIKEQLKEMEAETFPPGMDYKIAYDVSEFLEASIEKVLHTLLEAFILVTLVVYIFLGDVRATLIPTLAVPVSVIGTFYFLQLFGLSINLITLFALVLAIGTLVDDAIVVVEAMHAKLEAGLTPFRAAGAVVNELGGAIIAITLVNVCVFVPVTFVPGPVGVFYRNFGITMSTSILLSGVVALTLSPVLCAMILKPHTDSHANEKEKAVKKPRSWVKILLSVLVGGTLLAGVTYLAYSLWGWIGLLIIPLPFVQRLFDRAVEKTSNGYAAFLRRVVKRRTLTLAVIGGAAFGIYAVTAVLPQALIPNEDQGVIYAVFQTPPGSTLEYTNHKSIELEKLCREVDEVEYIVALAGYEVLTQGRGSNAGTCILKLKNWSERKRTATEVIDALEEKCHGRFTDAKLEFFSPPAIPGFGVAGGLSLRVLDKTNTMDYERLGKVTEKFMAKLGQRKEVSSLFTFYSNAYPQRRLVINNKVAMQKGVSIKQAMDNLVIMIGSTFEQGFIRFNRFYRVFVQAAPEYRRFPEDLESFYVMNDKGDMVPYSSFMSIEKQNGMNEINRYNLYPTAPIQAEPAAGFSSGEAIQAVREVAAETLPKGYDIGWVGLSYDESRKGNEAFYILLIVIAFVYLVLAAQYESFLISIAVIMALPVGLFGAFLSLKIVGLANDVWAQLGMIMLVGLLAKNAILVVEYAIQRRQEGLSLDEAAVEGGQLRLRPILMTSFTAIAGLLPLIFATGVGAIGNRTIGTTGAGGMFVGTVIGVLVIPGLYYLFARLAGDRKLLPDESEKPLTEDL